jgi:endonuclease YncB( thermonuclease family)
MNLFSRSGILLAFFYLQGPCALAETLTGRIVSIADGDTVTLLSSDHQQTRIRLFQIDAPEKSQSFGQKSKASLSELVFGQAVEIRVETHDRYGRTVGTLYQGGVDINLEQVKRGMAWVYRQYARDPQYYDAETAAQEQHIGLWAEPSPTPPWVYRHGEKMQGSVTTPRSTHPTHAECHPDLRCRDIGSCEEAMAILARCGPGKIDGDRDGIPCESLCKGTSH